jgi:formylglycine-generating enzyme
MASVATRRLPSRSTVVLGLALCACSREHGDRLDPIGAGMPAQTYSDFPGCTHPAVDPDCDDGWCRIPAGCFIMGSPETEWGRGMYSEQQVPVTLTHAFLIQQHEATQAEWTALGLPNPSGRWPENPDRGECLEPDCPVCSVSWFEAVAFANLLSEHNDPPLEPCYELIGCTGEVGRGMTCTGYALPTTTIYDCEGYRLPSEAEWEYAARAGTRTAFYTGDITPLETTAACGREQNLEPVAWYCMNAGGLTHPVGNKRPNGWNLFDILGNAFEWVHETQTGDTPAGPLTDPGGGPEQYPSRMMRGGCYLCNPALHRSASGPIEQSWNQIDTAAGVGFRLVRTTRE